MSTVIKKIEKKDFTSKLLNDLQTTFKSENFSAVKEIQRLKTYLEVFEQRGTRNSIGKNEVYGLFNNFFYWISI